MEFAQRYAAVPAEQRAALQQFRAQHPPQRCTVNGTEWTYLQSAPRDETLLWLVGGLKRADAAYRSIPLLSDAYRIIAPNYPALGTMSALADGLAGVLDAAQVEQTHLLAGSFGGMIAQEFVRRHPQRVAKLILSTTTPPDTRQRERYQPLLEMVQATPDERLQEQAVQMFMGIIAPPDEQQAFYRAYLGELFEERMSKADVVSTYQALLDFTQRLYTPDDLAQWQGDLLIINSVDDATFGQATQQAMLELYPQAEVYTFENAGHSPATTQRERYFQIVREFLGR